MEATSALTFLLHSNMDRFYTREAASIELDNATSTYMSEDLADSYDGVCEYLPQCGLSTQGTCGGDDRCEKA